MGVTNLDFIVDSLDGSQNPTDGFCDVPADECRYNALDCNPEKTDACLGNFRCDVEIGENCENSELDCGACVVLDNPDLGNPSGGSNPSGSSGGSPTTTTLTTTNTTTTTTGTQDIQNLNGDDTDEDDSGLGFLETTTSEPQTFFSRITGAVTGTLGTVGTTVISIFLIGILGSSIAVRQIRKNKESK